MSLSLDSKPPFQHANTEYFYELGINGVADSEAAMMTPVVGGDGDNDKCEIKSQ